MADMPADWAIMRARELRDEEYSRVRSLAPMDYAFARYIEAHEEPPVDPLLIEARKLAAADARTYYGANVWCGQRLLRGEEAADAILAGEADNESVVRCRLNALRRGMELAKEQSHG